MDQETDEGVQRKTNVTRAGNLMMVWEKIAKSDVKLGYEENNEKAFGEHGEISIQQKCLWTKGKMVAYDKDKGRCSNESYSRGFYCIWYDQLIK